MKNGEAGANRITVKFDCRECGLVNAEAKVRRREKEEDILSWMASVKRVVYFTHQQKSPRCQAKTVDLKIPLVEDAMIGEKGHENPTL